MGSGAVGRQGARGARGGGDDDVDGDCFAAAEDCNDADASVYPGAEEQCDGVDHDCGQRSVMVNQGAPANRFN